MMLLRCEKKFDECSGTSSDFNHVDEHKSAYAHAGEIKRRTFSSSDPVFKDSLGVDTHFALLAGAFALCNLVAWWLWRGSAVAFDFGGDVGKPLAFASVLACAILASKWRDM